MPERWLVLSVRVPGGDADGAATAALVALGAGAVEEAGDTLRTYLPPPDDVEAFLARARRELRDALGGAAPEIGWEWRPDEDWASAWRRGLGPRRVGERLVVAPPWSRPEAVGAAASAAGREEETWIVIDPGMAFGTGEHASTRGVLRLLEGCARAGDRVLDVGAGSAVLAIAAVRLGAAHALAVENDADALENAEANVLRNGVQDRVQILHATVDEAFLAGQREAYDVILANVLSGVLRPLLGAFRTALAPGGRLILGGILQDEASVMIAAATPHWTLVREDREDGWWSALLEPAPPPGG
jgi:ribosomal protein L11 methyltransferase